MDNKQFEIIQTIVAMFKAAPGAKYLGEFTIFVNTADGSVAGLANVLANTDVFKQSMYADTLTNQEFSTQFVESMLGALVSAKNKSWATSEIENMLAAGQGRGDVIHWAATALAAVPSANTDWVAASVQFNNKVDVATHYSVDLGGSASTLSVLQQVTADVTNLAATVTAAKALFETGVSGNVIDGYVKGATVFADLNGDGILNAGEVSTTTDAFGNFKFPAGATGFGNLISTGGTD
ncbi:MAG: calcium-binding protein, partial [Nitrosomonas sp.]|nr:calcium-binding protein [Nitrosomonas sp.]MDP1950945.1 calcium-binding protein [Nitrosomonas sp.]